MSRRDRKEGAVEYKQVILTKAEAKIVLHMFNLIPSKLADVKSFQAAMLRHPDGTITVDCILEQQT